MQVAPFMDRSIASIPKAQQGFITYICLPLLESLVELYPQLKGIAANMRANVRTLHEMEGMSTDQIMALPIPPTLTSPLTMEQLAAEFGIAGLD